jgi:chemosensory pili system protein ChpA (sensor histidine kinase/response regulator)
MESILAKLAEAETRADSIVLDQARSLATAVFPALIELRDGGVLEPSAANAAVFLTLSGIEQLADGAIYGLVESLEGGQSRVCISEETADAVQEYLDGIRRTDSLVQLHRSAVSTLCESLSLQEVEDSYEPSIPATDNVVQFQGNRTEQPDSADIDEELLELFIETLDEYSESIDHAIAGISAGDENALRRLKNTLHTVKGAANSVGLARLGALIHDLESRILDIEHAGTVSAKESVTAIDAMVDQFTEATGFVRKFKADWDQTANKAAQPLADTPANDLEDEHATGDQKSENLRVETHRVDRLLDMGLEISMGNVRCRQSLDAASQDRAEVQNLARRVLTLVDRLSLQLDTEIQAKTESMPQGGQFDPLEMDRMTEKQGLAAILREAAYDLEEEARELGLHLENALRETQSSSRLLQTNQSELRQLRLVSFSKLGPGLRRLVHQVSRQLGKQVNFEFDCGRGELDIRVFEQLRVALEHMLRNAIDHGIGTPEERRKQGKADHGQLKLSIARSGSEFTIRLIDDGQGIDPDSLRQRAMHTGLVTPVDDLSDAEALRLILSAGFTTAEQVTDVSGRGVGMDVVYQSITQVGGTIEIQSKPGYFTQFDLRVPSSIMVNEALLATVGEEQIAIPLTSLKGSEFRRRDDVHAATSDPEGRISFRGNEYEVRYLGAVRGTRPAPALEAMPDFVPVLYAQLKRRRVAFFADGLETAEDMVIRALGSQYTGVPGIAGGAVKSDGQPVLALDLNEFIGQVDYADQQAANDNSVVDEGTLVLCVDDSVMMRRTYDKRLSSLGYTVVTAVDGADALDYLSQTSRAPDFIFTDLEMPNMNGFDFIANLRRAPGMKHIPTVVVSSRDADKHRAEAQRVGASGFMAKGANGAEEMQSVIEQHLEAARTAMVS